MELNNNIDKLLDKHGDLFDSGVMEFRFVKNSGYEGDNSPGFKETKVVYVVKHVLKGRNYCELTAVSCAIREFAGTDKYVSAVMGISDSNKIGRLTLDLLYQSYRQQMLKGYGKNSQFLLNMIESTLVQAFKLDLVLTDWYENSIDKLDDRTEMFSIEESIGPDVFFDVLKSAARKNPVFTQTSSFHHGQIFNTFLFVGSCKENDFRLLKERVLKLCQYLALKIFAADELIGELNLEFNRPKIFSYFINSLYTHVKNMVDHGKEDWHNDCIDYTKIVSNVLAELSGKPEVLFSRILKMFYGSSASTRVFLS